MLNIHRVNTDYEYVSKVVVLLFVSCFGVILPVFCRFETSSWHGLKFMPKTIRNISPDSIENLLSLKQLTQKFSSTHIQVHIQLHERRKGGFICRMEASKLLLCFKIRRNECYHSEVVIHVTAKLWYFCGCIRDTIQNVVWREHLISTLQTKFQYVIYIMLQVVEYFINQVWNHRSWSIGFIAETKD